MQRHSSRRSQAIAPEIAPKLPSSQQETPDCNKRKIVELEVGGNDLRALKPPSPLTGGGTLARRSYGSNEEGSPHPMKRQKTIALDLGPCPGYAEQSAEPLPHASVDMMEVDTVGGSTTASKTPARAFPSVSETPWPPNLLRPNQVPCGHTIHPALESVLNNTRCPLCQMKDAMSDVRKAENIILDHCGIDKWYQQANNKNRREITRAMTLIRGGRPRKNCPGLLDFNGNDRSYRHAKNRLLRLADTLSSHSQVEKQWEQQLLIGTENEGDTSSAQMLRMRYSATNALALYDECVKKGTFIRVEKNEAALRRKIGDDMQTYTNKTHRKSGLTLETPLVEVDMMDVAKVSSLKEMTTTVSIDKGDNQPKRKPRCTNARVSFDPEVYVRTEANVDELRWAASSLSEDFLDDDHLTPTPMPGSFPDDPPQTDSKPKRPHEVLALKSHDGPRRHKSQFLRPRQPQQPTRYSPGLWAVARDHVVGVNTSGDRWTWPSWRNLNRIVQEEGKHMDGKISRAKARAAKEEEKKAMEASKAAEEANSAGCYPPANFFADLEAEYAAEDPDEVPLSQQEPQSYAGEASQEDGNDLDVQMADAHNSNAGGRVFSFAIGLGGLAAGLLGKAVQRI